MGIADMLKLIYRHTKGHEGQRLLQMGKTKLIRLIAEKPLGVGIQ